WKRRRRSAERRSPLAATMPWNPDIDVVDRAGSSPREEARSDRGRAGVRFALNAGGRGVSVVLLGLGHSGCLVPQSVEQNDNASRQHTVPIIDLSSLPSYLSSPSIPVYLQGTDDVRPQWHSHPTTRTVSCAIFRSCSDLTARRSRSSWT